MKRSLCPEGTEQPGRSMWSRFIEPCFKSARLSSYRLRCWTCGDAVSMADRGAVRVWETVQSPKSVDRSRCAFTVCTYNVLSQFSLESTAFLYVKCNREHLAWPHRWERLKRELQSLNADIFCLQEVDDVTYPSFTAFFSRLNYAGAFKKRTGEKHDGCATFWRKDMFTVLETKGVEYAVPGTYVDRDNVALLVKLKIRRKFVPGRVKSLDHRILVVVNTHLLFNMNRGDIKLAQLTILLANVQKMAQNWTNDNGEVFMYPVTLCGDFNSTPESAIFSLITTGQLNYLSQARNLISGRGDRGGPHLNYPLVPKEARVFEQFCRLHDDLSCYGCVNEQLGLITHQLPLSCAFQFAVPEGQPVSTVVYGGSCFVDYIFHGPSYDNVGERHKGARLNCTAYSSLLTEEDVVKSVGALPNEYCGSDHLPMLAKFEYVFNVN